MSTFSTQRHPVRLAREARNLTREQLAENVKVGASTIKRAEKGESINLHSRQQLCHFFGMTALELGLISGIDNVEANLVVMKDLELLPAALRKEEMGDYTMGNQFDPARRTLLLQMLGLAFLSPQELLNPEKRKLLTSVGDETVDQYEQLIQTCWKLSNKNSLDAIEQLLQLSLPAITAVAEHSSAHQQRAANLASQGYQLAYIIASHREDFATSLSHCKKAKQYGSIARDPNLQVASLIRQGVTFLHRKSPFQTLESYQEGLQYINDITPLVRTRLYAALAEVEGKLGMEQEARRSIGLAKDNFPAQPENDPASRYVHFGESSLFLHEGLALLDLHKSKEAMESFLKVDGLRPKMSVSERSRIDFLNQQATAAGQLHDLDQFSLYMKAAVTSAKTIESDLRYSEAWDVYKHTQHIQIGWGNEPRFKALAQLFQR